MRLSVTLALLAALGACSSGSAGPRFEAFPIETTPASDAFPDAPGVVLLDRGVLELTVDVESRRPLGRLRRYHRLKILRESGDSLREVVIPYDPGMVISGLIARVISSDGSETYVDRGDFQEVEHPSGRAAKRFVVESAPPGSVIEYAYDLFIPDLRFLPPWRFSARLPTVRSELAILVPPAFSIDYRTTEHGQVLDWPPERFEVEGGARLFWTKSNQPALFDDPGLPAPELIAPTLHLRFVEADLVGGRVEGFKSWDSVRQWLDEKAPSWARLDQEQQQTARTVAGETSNDEKALKLFTVIARDLGWAPGPHVPLWRAHTPSAETVLKMKRGNATSRGLVLVALLRAAGLEAYPALVAYRDRGVLLPDFPTPRAIDAVVAALPKQDGYLVLDPAQMTASAEIASPRLQGTRMVVLRDDSVDVTKIPIAQASASTSEVSYILRLGADGRLAGKLSGRFLGSEAGILRGLLLAAEPGEYATILSDFLARRGGIIAVNSVQFADLRELRRPLSVKASLVETRLFSTGDDSIVSIPLEKLFKEQHPELSDTRRNPYLFAAPRSVSMRGLFFLPEGHEATGLPEAFSAEWKGGSTQVSVQQETQQRLRIERKSQITTLEVMPADYPSFVGYQREVDSADRLSLTIQRPPEKTYEY